MKRLFSAGFLFLLALSMTCCEGYRIAKGIVIDSASGEPLDSVFVNVLTGIDSLYTDSTGSYAVQNRMSGCLFGCKDITVEFSKPGYQTQTLTNDAASGTILLTP